MQPFFEKALGVRFVPDYKPAAGGALAWQTLANAKADGYTLAGFNSPHVITQPLTMEDVQYKTEDFTYLTMIENTPATLVVKKGFPAKTLTEFIDYAKKNPGENNDIRRRKIFRATSECAPVHETGRNSTDVYPAAGDRTGKTANHGWTCRCGVYKLTGCS